MTTKNTDTTILLVCFVFVVKGFAERTVSIARPLDNFLSLLHCDLLFVREREKQTISVRMATTTQYSHETPCAECQQCIIRTVLCYDLCAIFTVWISMKMRFNANDNAFSPTEGIFS